MVIKYPSYYKKFKCIADKCTDTCCVSWQIVIDQDTADFYNSVNTNFGQQLRNVMYKDEDNDIVFKNTNGRCPFLNEENLCNIYINLGEEHLCHTCTMYPRFIESFGGTKEIGLSLSCPVANELILKDTNLDFIIEYNDEMPEINDIDAELYMALKDSRGKLFSYLKSEVDIKTKINAIYSYSLELQKLINNNDINGIEELNINNSKLEINFDLNIMNSLEYLTEQGRALLLSYNSKTEIYYTDKFNNILFYFVYRYFLKSVYDEDVYSKLMFCLFSVNVIAILQNATQESLSYITRMYSKEIEHSQVNLNSIKEYIKTIKIPR